MAGGSVIFQGTPEEICMDGLYGYLSGRITIPVLNCAALQNSTLEGAHGNNLKDIDIRIGWYIYGCYRCFRLRQEHNGGNLYGALTRRLNRPWETRKIKGLQIWEGGKDHHEGARMDIFVFAG
ncbi:MAG: hypothetical protein L7F78_10975 [Syntrophales bacterium LBB04]|nr:hypothetical protein [Syntrophales bacterium LBB04]